MIIESNVKYRIHILIQLAKLTSDDRTKEDLIEESRTLLEYIEIEQKDHIPGESDTRRFISSLTDEDISGSTFKEMMNAFNRWAGNDALIFNRREFKNILEQERGFVLKPKWIDGKNQKIYCRTEEER